MRIKILILLFIVFSNFSYADLNSVHLTIKGNPKNSVVITWRELAQNPAPEVRYGLESGYYSWSAKGTSHPCPNALISYIHDVELNNLQPGTRYFYKCGSDQTEWSQEYSFITAPEGPVDFSFTAYGNQGTSGNAVMVTNQAKEQNPNLHLHLGNLCYANEGAIYNWDIWFRMIEPVASQIIYMPTIGDKENEKDIFGNPLGFSSYLGRFELPNNEKWYSFDWGNVHFICLDTEEDHSIGSEQYAWVANDLLVASNRSDIEWIVVYFNNPPYCYAGQNTIARDHLVPLFDTYGVDLVLSAKYNLYERSYPLKGNQVVDDRTSFYQNLDGTIYVVSGGGGAGLEQSGKAWWTCANKSEYHFVKANIEGQKVLHFQAISAISGTLIDEFTISKWQGPSPTPNPTNTPIFSYTPTNTPIPSSTPTPTNSPLPSNTPTPTPTTPPIDVLGGYWDTFLNHGSDCILKIMAFVPQDEAKGIFVSINGNISGLQLFDDGKHGDASAGDRLFGVEFYLRGENLPSIGRNLIELAIMGDYQLLELWPYLIVR